MQEDTIKSIGQLFQEAPIVKDTRKTMNPRSALVERFVENINKERDGKVWKKVTGQQIAIKVSHLNMDSLYYLFSLCTSAQSRKQSFSKVFYGSLKIK